MPFDTLRSVVSRRPWAIVGAWLALAATVVLLAPNLTKLAAEGQAHLLPADSESAKAAELLRGAWPDQWYSSMAVATLTRPAGLTDADRRFARTLAASFEAGDRPEILLRVIGPTAQPEIAQRLVSADRTTELILIQFSTSFVSPATIQLVDEIEARSAALSRPDGLALAWTGDAVIGRDYMADVQRSLDRAAIATVFLLLGVLLAVYRSLWLAIVPLSTIGVGLAISRGVLGWMAAFGWDISPLVELFLVVILFGCGTDLCLFLSWRFGEHWNPANPGAAMRATLRRAIGAILTSAGTVIAGLMLMGTTRFKLFSSTGPSVSIGLAITLAATLTLTPALLVLLARYRPKAFAGLTSPSSGFWDRIAHLVLQRPVLAWGLTLLALAPAAVFGLLRPTFIQDTPADMPASTPSVAALRLVGSKFGPGVTAPLTVVLTADEDLRQSEGLALIDDVSRLLTRQRQLVEVRSATQPLGSTEPLERARLGARLGEIGGGFGQIAEGARRLQNGLAEGGGKLRTAILMESMTGLPLTGTRPPTPVQPDAPEAKAAPAGRSRGVFSALRQAFTAGGPVAPATKAAPDEPAPAPAPAAPATKAAPSTPPADPRDQMLRALSLAAAGAAQVAEGADRGRREIEVILDDPVARRALDRLLLTPENVRENPDLQRSLAAYIAPDGRTAQLDLQQSERPFSGKAMDQVVTLRRRIHEFLAESRDEAGLRPRAVVTGSNADSADIRALTERDQVQTWIIVPLGVFLILLLALRDVGACINLVATMLLTYAFALGVTHLMFVTILGAEGLDWKVPYFLFVLLVAVGVDYNVFLMARLQEEAQALGLKSGITRAVAQTGGLISSAAAITACSFSALIFSPLSSLRQLGFALVVGITVDAVIVRPILVPCGHWLLHRRADHRRRRVLLPPTPPVGRLARVAD